MGKKRITNPKAASKVSRNPKSSKADKPIAGSTFPERAPKPKKK